MAGLLNEVDLADRGGLHLFELGEQHHIEFPEFLPNLLVGSACHRLAQKYLQASVPVRLMSKSIDEPID